MSNCLYIEPEQTIRLLGQAPQILRLCIENMQKQPLIALREYICNAFDAAFEAPDEPIKVEFNHNSIIIKDQGEGMTRRMMETQSFNGDENMSKGEHGSSIGEFGLGRFTAFSLASRIEILTQHEKESHAWRLIWIKGQEQMQLYSALPSKPGTKIALYLKPIYQHLAKFEILKAYLGRTFALLRRAVHLGKSSTLVNPAYQWLEPIVRQAEHLQQEQRNLVSNEKSEPLFQQYFPNHQSLASYVSTAADGTRFLLSITEPLDESEAASTPQLFKKGVWVCESPEALLPKEFRFIRVLVDNPYFKIPSSRDEVILDDPSYLDLSGDLRQRVYDFFMLLGKEQPTVLQKILCKYRESILAYANRQSNSNWQYFLSQHYQLWSLQGFTSWKYLCNRLSAFSASPQLALANTEAEIVEGYTETLISNEDIERDFIKQLAADSQIDVIELDQLDPLTTENIALKLYCVSLMHSAISQLRRLGAEEGGLPYLQRLYIQLDQNEKDYEKSLANRY